MQRRGRLLTRILGLSGFAVACWFAVAMLRRPPERQIQVVVAAWDLAPGSRLSRHDVETRRVRTTLPTRGLFRRVESVRGRTLRAPKLKGQAVYVYDLVPLASESDPDGRQPTRERTQLTIALPASRILISSLAAGDPVDLLAGERPIARRVPVLAIDAQNGRVTLLVTTRQADAVSTAQRTGRIRVARSDAPP